VTKSARMPTKFIVAKSMRCEPSPYEVRSCLIHRLVKNLDRWLRTELRTFCGTSVPMFLLGVKAMSASGGSAMRRSKCLKRRLIYFARLGLSEVGRLCSASAPLQSLENRQTCSRMGQSEATSVGWPSAFTRASAASLAFVSISNARIFHRRNRCRNRACAFVWCGAYDCSSFYVSLKYARGFPACTFFWSSRNG
jgi:hypothetical protein